MKLSGSLWTCPYMFIIDVWHCFGVLLAGSKGFYIFEADVFCVYENKMYVYLNMSM